MTFVTIEHLLVLIMSIATIAYIGIFITLLKCDEVYPKFILDISRPKTITVALSITAYAVIDAMWGDWSFTIFNVISMTIVHGLYYIFDNYPKQ